MSPATRGRGEQVRACLAWPPTALRSRRCSQSLAWSAPGLVPRALWRIDERLVRPAPSSLDGLDRVARAGQDFPWRRCHDCLNRKHARFPWRSLAHLRCRGRPFGRFPGAVVAFRRRPSAGRSTGHPSSRGRRVLAGESRPHFPKSRRAGRSCRAAASSRVALAGSARVTPHGGACATAGPTHRAS